eukprot:7247927-Pyramimonas_sp.AAC.2
MSTQRGPNRAQPGRGSASGDRHGPGTGANPKLGVRCERGRHAGRGRGKAGAERARQTLEVR